MAYTPQLSQGLQTMSAQKESQPPEAAAPAAPLSPAESQPSSSKANSVLARRRPRAKRGKYISKACNECKRRKSKCNGQHPCEHCVYHSLHCNYPASPIRGPGPPASTPAHSTSIPPHISHVIESLKSEVSSLQSDLNRLRHQQNTPTGCSPASTDEVSQKPHSVDQPVTRPRSQNGSSCQRNTVEGYTGPPTSLSFTGSSPGDETGQPAVNYTFNLSLARRHLQEQAADLEAIDAPDASRTANNSRPGSPSVPNYSEMSTVDPLWLIDKREALRLCYVYEEEIGISYPFLELGELIDKTHKLYDAMEVGHSHGFPASSVPGPTVIETNDLNILRMVFSTALTTESSGSSELGRALFVKAREVALRKLWEPTSVKCIALYTLLAIYEFLSGDDLQAWRLIGIPARWCLELGLHQSATFKGPPEKTLENKMLIRLFWCLHTLDRRWAFGVGLPFVFQSSDVDANMPMPDDEVPYLQAMVLLGRISARVWLAMSNSSRGATEPPKDELDFLHYRLDRWYDELPDSLKLPDDAETQASQQLPRGMRRLRLLLYLRARQMKILLYQRVLHSPDLFHTNSSLVRMVVDMAKDMIQKLDRLNKTTDIYQTQQMCFNHFLVSALGVIFLAVALAPSVYRSIVRDEFHMALDLVRGFSEKSYVSKRLWRMIRGLRQAGFTLGLTGSQPGEADNGRCARNGPKVTSGVDDSEMQNRSLMSPPNSASHLSQTSVPPDSNTYHTTADGFRDDISMFPLNGSQMTLELNNIFTAMDCENGFAMPGFAGDGTHEPMLVGGAHEGDPRVVDLAEIWNTLDYID